jgi:hypothetical protein
MLIEGTEYRMTVKFAAIDYQALKERVLKEDPQIDERTLNDTVEGMSDLPQLLTTILRAALEDEALVGGLKTRIDEMERRQQRLRDRATRRRQLVKKIMLQVNLKNLIAPDFSASIRPGVPALTVLDEAAVPRIYWESREPRLKRQDLVSDLKRGNEIAGVALANSEPVLSVRTK